MLLFSFESRGSLPTWSNYEGILEIQQSLWCESAHLEDHSKTGTRAGKRCTALLHSRGGSSPTREEFTLPLPSLGLQADPFLEWFSQNITVPGNNTWEPSVPFLSAVSPSTYMRPSGFYFTIFLINEFVERADARHPKESLEAVAVSWFAKIEAFRNWVGL